MNSFEVASRGNHKCKKKIIIIITAHVRNDIAYSINRVFNRKSIKNNIFLNMSTRLRALVTIRLDYPLYCNFPAITIRGVVSLCLSMYDVPELFSEVKIFLAKTGF